jgi:hypothetical protein
MHRRLSAESGKGEIQAQCAHAVLTFGVSMRHLRVGPDVPNVDDRI